MLQSQSIANILQPTLLFQNQLPLLGTRRGLGVGALQKGVGIAWYLLENDGRGRLGDPSVTYRTFILLCGC